MTKKAVPSEATSLSRQTSEATRARNAEASVRKQFESEDDPELIFSVDQEEVEDRRSDRKLKQYFAWGILGIIFCELIAIFTFFGNVGTGYFTYEPLTLQIFLAATFGQTILTFNIMVRNLFPKKDNLQR